MTKVFFDMQYAWVDTWKIIRIKKLTMPRERTAMYSLDLTPPNAPATNVNADLEQRINEL